MAPHRQIEFFLERLINRKSLVHIQGYTRGLLLLIAYFTFIRYYIWYVSSKTVVCFLFSPAAKPDSMRFVKKSESIAVADKKYFYHYVFAPSYAWVMPLHTVLQRFSQFRQFTQYIP